MSILLWWAIARMVVDLGAGSDQPRISDAIFGKFGVGSEMAAIVEKAAEADV